MQLPLPSTAVRLPGNFFESVLQFPSSRDNYTPFPDKDHHREEQEVFKLVFPTAPWSSSWASQLLPLAPATQGTFTATEGFGSLSFQGGFLNQPPVAQFQQEGGFTPSLQGRTHSTASLPCHTTTASQHPLKKPSATNSTSIKSMIPIQAMKSNQIYQNNKGSKLPSLGNLE